MQKKFNLLLAVIALLVWSATLLYFYASGRIDDFLAERFRVMALIGGLGLAVVAIFNFTQLFAKAPSSCCGHDHSHDHDHDHDHSAHSHGEHDHDHDHAHAHAHAHSHAEPAHDHEHDHEDHSFVGNAVTFVLMTVPLLVAASYSQDAYVSPQTILNKTGDVRVKWDAGQSGGSSAGQVGSDKAGEDNTAGAEDKWEYTLDDLKKVVDTSEQGNLMLAVDQLFYTSGDAELQRVLEGQSIETTGQVIPELGKNPDGKRIRVFRLMATCCAADAQPVSVPVEFADGAPNLKEGEIKEMTWVKVTGTMTYYQEEGRTQALIKAKTFEKTDEPMDYLMF